MRKDYYTTLYPPKTKSIDVGAILVPIIMLLVFLVILFAEAIGNWICALIGL